MLKQLTFHYLNKNHAKKIISGGKSEGEIAALDADIQLHILHAGWAYRGAKVKRSYALVILSVLVFFNEGFSESIEQASDQQIGLIKKGFSDPAIVLKSAAVIQSNDRYYIGLTFLAKGFEMQGIGIWIVEGTKHHPSKVYSVNAVARLFSGYVSADQTTLAVSMAEPKVKTILNYLKKK